MNIKEIRVLLTDGPDHISIITDLPCPYVKDFAPSQQPLELDFQASMDTGADYVKRVFKMEPKVTNVRSRSCLKFSR